MFPNESKILIVDDQKVIRTLVRKHLNDLGFTNIVEADDGATAWPLYVQALAERKPFNLVISDMNMPLMNGMSFLIKVRSYHANKDTPFILLTAENDKDTVVKSMQWKVNAFIVKPFTRELLVSKMTEVHQVISAAA
ncbi:MAG: response regulator [Bdellovibrionales bacterium]|nr:response regulator [Bdellovibrionales bacterium]